MNLCTHNIYLKESCLARKVAWGRSDISLCYSACPLTSQKALPLEHACAVSKTIEVKGQSTHAQSFVDARGQRFTRGPCCQSISHSVITHIPIEWWCKWLISKLTHHNYAKFSSNRCSRDIPPGLGLGLGLGLGRDIPPPGIHPPLTMNGKDGASMH